MRGLMKLAEGARFGCRRAAQEFEHDIARLA